MTENLAGRGEGLAGLRSVDQDYIRDIREWKRSGKVDLAEIEELVLNMAAALEAAAPAGTAPDDDDECSARDNKYQCTLPKEHAGPHKAHGFQRVLHEWAALATPSPQPYNSEQEFGKSGVGPLIGPDGSGSATGANLQQPAGSGALDRERCEGLYLKFSEPLMEPHTPVIIERVNGNCTVSQFIIARDEAHQLINQLSEFLRVGSPRKVGEDGPFNEAADAVVRWANGWKSRMEAGLYDVDGMKAADIRRDEGMDIAKHLRSLRPSSVPVGEQKQEEGV